ncbi:MAG: hypothetical protein ACI8XD_001898 [Thermoproteota archaeon]|jgi:hypothetical protein
MLIYGPDKPSVLPGKQTACQNIQRNNPAGRLQGAEERRCYISAVSPPLARP